MGFRELATMDGMALPPGAIPELWIVQIGTGWHNVGEGCHPPFHPREYHARCQCSTSKSFSMPGEIVNDDPALLGGKPVRPLGPPDWPGFDPDVAAAVQAAQRDGSWGRYEGPHVERLELELARYFGVPFALTCASGTLAVEIALRAVPVGPGDEVILSAYD